MSFLSHKIRMSAKGEQCTMNTPWCNYDEETVVLCHLNESYAGKGIGMKAHDYAAFYGCSDCHDIYDRRKHPHDAYLNDEDFYVLRAVIRTWGRLFEKGIVKIC